MNDLFFYLGCAGIGALSGFLGGLLGIGGGVVIVPSLIFLFGAIGLFGSTEAVLFALGSSLCAIVFTSWSAARAQARAGMVRWEVVRRWAPFVVIGSLLAGFIATALGGEVLRFAIAAFLVFVAVVMMTSWKPAAHRSLPGWLGSATVGTTAGTVSGLAGIGGGNVIVPTLVYLNVPVHNATATASTLGVPLALAGAAGYVAAGWGAAPGVSGTLGFIHAPSVVAIVALSVMTAPVGVRLAHRIAPLPLRRGFGVLLLVVSARMVWSGLSAS